MLPPIAAALLAAPLFSTAVCSAVDDDDGTKVVPDTTILEANLGEFWFGAEIEKEDLIGKVVLLEIWGS